ncbi:hypothetical protein COU77_02515 [Candidatus Peregrinibacteria bacterium CG10_big_fil_rev_8_21_14_0_10_49_16]|nr:MAG: hypothetical protein COW95_01015 [Candidatus Peregrinibacteria bacterium CG22_combo_CG10-13_8_21_14_all_49_11]PIR52046.1 MAG: hypothetical protein COU77_02515 [Candidatus Peregrinibacteria bacterium CG10_big_fil_rev_8_21_14_0_10_49_16]
MSPRETEWVIIDGAPSSGKTTIVHALHTRGFRIIPEVARSLIDIELAKGRSLEHIRGELGSAIREEFQESLLSIYLQQFRNIDPEEFVIFDGALPHIDAYIALENTTPIPEVMEESQKYHFRQVFVFDPLPFEHDHVRVEDQQSALFLDQKIRSIYHELGYQPISVPVASVEERLGFVLAHLQCIFADHTSSFSARRSCRDATCARNGFPAFLHAGSQ